MRNVDSKRMRIAAAATVGGLTLAGVALAMTPGSAHAGVDAAVAPLVTATPINTPTPMTTSTMTTPATPQRITVSLSPMPQGTVTLGRDSRGDVQATINAFGLTPGSLHLLDLVNGRTVHPFGSLMATGTGQATAMIDSSVKFTPGHWQVEILNGATPGDPVSAEPIAESARYVPGRSTYQLIAVEDANGVNHGTPRGRATITYNPGTQTISVTLTASGLTPGAHAAHIHLGSCQSQGAVQYMLMDFTANGAGVIRNQTRTVTGVTTPIPATGWYLNLHQGNSNNILSNGQPTINFRPLLCANL